MVEAARPKVVRLNEKKLEERLAEAFRLKLAWTEKFTEMSSLGYVPPILYPHLEPKGVTVQEVCSQSFQLF